MSSLWEDYNLQLSRLAPGTFATIAIGGAETSPPQIEAIDKVRASANFLADILFDLSQMQDYAINDLPELCGTFYDIRGSKKNTKKKVLQSIGECAKLDTPWIHIYYTGKGEKHTGNWCFADGVISYNDILDVINSECCRPKNIWIYTSCPYAIYWDQARRYDKSKYRNIEWVSKSCAPV